MYSKKILALLASFAFYASLGHASPMLEQIGTPTEAGGYTLETQGVSVPTKLGLKEMLPDGWRVYVHKAVTMPNTVSWAVGSNWVAALDVVANMHGVQVLVDWDKESVYFKPTPAVDIASHPTESPSLEARSAGETPSGKALDVADLKSAIEHLASAAGYSSVVWNTHLNPIIDHPITVYEKSVEEDLDLLLKGSGLPLNVMLYPANGTVIVADGNGSVSVDPTFAPNRPMPRDVIAGHPANGSTLEPVTYGVNGKASAPLDMLGAQGTSPKIYKFVLPAGARLKPSLEHFMSELGWRVKWSVDTDFEAGADMEFTGNSLVNVLVSFLSDMSMTADLYHSDKIVVVKPIATVVQ